MGRRQSRVGVALGVECKRGHDNWIFSNGRSLKNVKRCLTCRNMRHAQESQGSKVVAKGPLGIKCTRNHDDWYQYENGYKRCYVCKNGRPSTSDDSWVRRDSKGRKHDDMGAPTTLLWDTLTREEVMRAREQAA